MHDVEDRTTSTQQQKEYDSDRTGPSCRRAFFKGRHDTTWHLMNHL